MQNETTLTKLNEKVSALVEHYNSLKGENETLRLELIKLKAESEIKSQELEKLREQNTLKDLEIEAIVDKLESIMV
jgi:regulator of replication initiation timing